jgi:hypothetical protein
MARGYSEDLGNIIKIVDYGGFSSKFFQLEFTESDDIWWAICRTSLAEHLLFRRYNTGISYRLW